MIKTNRTLMTEAKDALNGQWGKAVLVAAVYIVVFGVYLWTSECTQLWYSKGIFFLWFLGGEGAAILGFTMFFLGIMKRNPTKEVLLHGFQRKRYLTTVVAHILIALFVFLRTLLLIIPGLIALFDYSLVWFIIGEDETIRPIDAIKKSKKMMYGYKWKYFCLEFRFLGWGILSALSAGIGLLWLFPYMATTQANFYLNIKEIYNNTANEQTPAGLQ